MKAACRLCGSVLATPGRSTSALTFHLDAHKKFLVAGPVQQERDELYARMASVRGVSFTFLASPEMVRFGCTFQPLHSANGIKARIEGMYKEKKDLLIKGLGDVHEA